MTPLRRTIGARMGRAAYVAGVSVAGLWFCGTVILFHVQASRAGAVSRSGLLLTAQLAGLVSILAIGLLSARRLRDLDSSPWWSLLLAIPILGLVLYVLFAIPYLWFFPGSRAANRYGEAARKPAALTIAAALLGPLLVLCGMFVLSSIAHVDAGLF